MRMQSEHTFDITLMKRMMIRMIEYYQTINEIYNKIRNELKKRLIKCVLTAATGIQKQH